LRQAQFAKYSVTIVDPGTSRVKISKNKIPAACFRTLPANPRFLRWLKEIRAWRRRLKVNRNVSAFQPSRISWPPASFINGRCTTGRWQKRIGSASPRSSGDHETG
jgi:hypothetical protein